MKDQFSLFLPDYLLSRTVFYITLVWGFTTHFVDSITGFQGNYLKRVLIIFIIHVLTFRFIQLFKKIFIDYLKGKWIPIGLFLVLILATGLRGYVLAYIYEWTHLSHNFLISYRIQASICNYSIAIYIATITYGEIKRHNLISESLIDNQKQLRILNEKAFTENRNFEEASVVQIQSQLRDLMYEISNTKKDELRRLLQISIENVIKPLAKEVYRPHESNQAKNPELKKFEINWKLAFKNYANPKHLEYWGLVPTLAFMAAPVIGHAYGFKNGTIAILFFLLIVTGIVQMIGNIAVKFFELFHYKFRRIIFYFSTLCAALVIYQFIALVSMFLRSSFNPFWEVVIFSFMIHQINAVANEARIQANANTEKLLKKNRELEWRTARLKLMQNNRNREIANILHGQIQALLVSAYLKNEGADEDESMKNVEDLVKNLEQKIDLLGMSQEHQTDLSKTITEISNLWSDLTNFEVNTAPEVLAQINQDKPLLNIVGILINELVFNGVKHGKAKLIRISLELESPLILRLIVESHESKEENKVVTGTGNQLLEDCSISWSREFNAGALTTRVLLPIS